MALRKDLDALVAQQQAAVQQMRQIVDRGVEQALADMRENLSVLIKNSPRTMDEIARGAGVAEKSVRNAKDGTHAPLAEQLLKITTFLGIEPYEIWLPPEDFRSRYGRASKPKSQPPGVAKSARPRQNGGTRTLLRLVS